MSKQKRGAAVRANSTTSRCAALAWSCLRSASGVPSRSGKNNQGTWPKSRALTSSELIPRGAGRSRRDRQYLLHVKVSIVQLPTVATLFANLRS